MVNKSSLDMTIFGIIEIPVDIHLCGYLLIQEDNQFEYGHIVDFTTLTTSDYLSSL